MTLSQVHLSSKVFQVILSHAFTSEEEEIAGVLIGEHSSNVCRIVSLVPVKRTDKRKDRVELSSEQLVEASQYCDALSKEYGVSTTVVGWYHSHPHITVWPSHVDIRTQWSFQSMLEKNFIGIIVSLFNKAVHSGQKQRTSIYCFQSTSPSDQVEVPLTIVPEFPRCNESVMNALISIPQVVMQEEEIVLQQAEVHSKCNPLALHQNACVFSSSSNNILSGVTLPLLSSLEFQNSFLSGMIKKLKKRCKQNGS